MGYYYLLYLEFIENSLIECRKKIELLEKLKIDFTNRLNLKEDSNG